MEEKWRGEFSFPSPHSPGAQISPFQTLPPSHGGLLPDHQQCCGRPVLLNDAEFCFQAEARLTVFFSDVSNLSAVDFYPRCFSQFIKCMCQCTYKQTIFPTYLSSPNINIGKGVLPPMLLKWLLLLPLDGLGIIILINPVLRPRKEIYFRKHRQLHSKVLILTERYNHKTWQSH